MDSNSALKFPKPVGDLVKKCTGTLYAKNDVVHAYNKWYTTKREVYKEECWRRLLPLINIVLTQEFPNIYPRDAGPFITACAWKLWVLLGKRCFPTDTGIHAYARVCIRREIINELTKLVRQKPEATELGIEGPKQGRLKTHKDVEIKMFLEDLPDAIRNRVTEEIRFDGNLRTACLYILDRYLAGRTPAMEVLKDDYGIECAAFLCEYILIRMRIALYDFRDAKYEFSDWDKRRLEVSQGSVLWEG